MSGGRVGDPAMGAEHVVAAVEDPIRCAEAVLGQQGGGHSIARGHAHLERPRILTRIVLPGHQARGLQRGQPQCAHRLLDIQIEQPSGGCGRAKAAGDRGRMETQRVELAGVHGHGHPVGDLAAQGHGGHEVGAAPSCQFAHRERRWNHHRDGVEDRLGMVRLEIRGVAECAIGKDCIDDIHLGLAAHQRRRSLAAMFECEVADPGARRHARMRGRCERADAVIDQQPAVGGDGIWKLLMPQAGYERGDLARDRPSIRQRSRLMAHEAPEAVCRRYGPALRFATGSLFQPDLRLRLTRKTTVYTSRNTAVNANSPHPDRRE